MATSLLVLLDDLASALDDVALLTKLAARKTAGVLGDDLAVNAEQVTGLAATRELPVVWAVFKGSLLNKLILVPAALLLSLLAPWAITPVLMAGGLYLCFEGAEKLVHAYRRHRSGGPHAMPESSPHAPTNGDLAALEQARIRGAIRTDFVLSAEIVVITLGSVAGVAFPTQILVLAIVALLMTVGVYGLVAGIVKLDDLGLALSRLPGDQAAPWRWLGRRLVGAAPVLMRGLAVLGTLAMFLVGGGILAHGLPGLEHGLGWLIGLLPGFPGGALLPTLFGHALIGVLAGLLALATVHWWHRRQPASH